MGAILLAWCCALSGVVGTFNENDANAIGTRPRKCEEGTMWCSRCENTTTLWEKGGIVDPAWITWKQIFTESKLGADDVPTGLSKTDGTPITSVRDKNFVGNQYHYFEIVVQGGDGQSARDVRRDAVYFSLVSPEEIPVSQGAVTPQSKDDKMPAWDFFVGQDCVPQEGAWTNNGYGNPNANEVMKSIVLNVTKDGRYFIALQSRAMRYKLIPFDYTMKLSRGSLVSKYEGSNCTSLHYRYPDEIAAMVADNRQTGIVGNMLGEAVPFCGVTPDDLKYNVQYVYQTPAPGLTQREMAIVIGAVGGGVVIAAFTAGTFLWIRYKRTTRRMAKFSSLSRGLPDALLEGEGQEVAV